MVPEIIVEADHVVDEVLYCKLVLSFQLLQ